MSEQITDPWVRLTKDLKQASTMLGMVEARWLVDTYYSIQKLRVASGNRVEAAERSREPFALLGWNFHNLRVLEKDLVVAITTFSSAYTMGSWLQGICGIGPVLAANILATFDIRNCPTAGHWWRFAGLDPTLKWPNKEDRDALIRRVLGTSSKVEGHHIEACAGALNRRPISIMKCHWMLQKQRLQRQRQALEEEGRDPSEINMQPPLTTKMQLEKAIAMRPWNARARKTMYLVSDQFVRQRNREKGKFYGGIYNERKAYEVARNERGELADQAARGKTRLADGHIEARVRRYVSKMFLSHVHARFFEEYYGVEAPMPYPFTDNCKGDHRHFVGRPQHTVPPGRTLRQLYGEEE